MEVLEAIFLICLISGLLYSLATLIFGHTSEHAHGHLPVLQPILLVSGITAFGGAGFLLSRLTTLSAGVVLGLAVLIGAGLAVAAYYIWVEPMSRAENSTGYTMSQLHGKIAEVATTIPAEGLGEVYVSVISGTVYHMAASMEKRMIKEGTRVVVVEVRDHVLYVTPFPEYLEEETSER